MRRLERLGTIMALLVALPTATALAGDDVRPTAKTEDLEIRHAPRLVPGGARPARFRAGGGPVPRGAPCLLQEA